MSFYDLVDDVLVLIYNLLHTSGKISFVDAIHKLKRFSQLLNRLKQFPLRIIASEFANTELNQWTIYDPGNFQVFQSWQLFTEEFYSCVSLYQLPRLFELPLLFDLSLKICQYMDVQLLIDILPYLNHNHVINVNFVFFKENNPMGLLIEPITKHFSTLKPINLPKLRLAIIRMRSDEIFKIPPELPLEQLIGEHIECSSKHLHENLMVLKVTNPISFRIGKVPPNITHVELSGSLYFEDTKKLILQTKNSLKKLKIDCGNLKGSAYVEIIKQVPNLQWLSTDFTFDFNELKQASIQEIIMGLSSFYTSPQFTNLDGIGLKSLVVGFPITTSMQFADLLVRLELRKCKFADKLIIPSNITILALHELRSEELPILPMSLKELYLGKNSWKTTPDFRNHERLHTLHICLSGFYTLLAWPPNLRRLSVFSWDSNVDIVPLIPLFNEGLQILITYAPVLRIPSTLREFETYIWETPTLDDTYKLPKFRDLDRLCIEVPAYFIDLGLKIKCLNLKYLNLEFKFTSSEYFPILLPSSLEILVLRSTVGGDLHLEFPSNCCTNLRSLNISESVPFKYSYRSIGHGKRGTKHNKLNVISADYPPNFDFQTIGYPEEYMRNNKKVLEAKIFSYKSTPKNLFEVKTPKITFLNRNLRRHLKKRNEKLYFKRGSAKRRRT